MAIPASALVWPDAIDPSDQIDFLLDLSSLLEVGENIATWTLQVLPDSSAVGLKLGANDRATALVGNVLVLWPYIDPAHVSDATWAGQGATLPMEVTVVTTNSPARTRQRTVAIKVAQQ